MDKKEDIKCLLSEVIDNQAEHAAELKAVRKMLQGNGNVKDNSQNVITLDEHARIIQIFEQRQALTDKQLKDLICKNHELEKLKKEMLRSQWHVYFMRWLFVRRHIVAWAILCSLALGLIVSVSLNCASANRIHAQKDTELKYRYIKAFSDPELNAFLYNLDEFVDTAARRNIRAMREQIEQYERRVMAISDSIIQVEKEKVKQVK